MKTKFYLAVVLIVLSVCSLKTNADSWVQKANFGGAARVNAAGFSIGTKGYVGTGYNWTSSTKDFWEWDQTTNLWTQKADFGGTARTAAVGFSIGTKGYIGTGTDGSGDRNDFWEYDQGSNTWTQKANFGGSGRYSAVGFSIGLKGYIGTGTDTTNTQQQDFWEYDQGTDTWLQKANFGGGVRQVAVGFSIGNKGYIGTGAYWGGSNWIDCVDFWEWNQATNIWTQKANFGGAAREQCVGFSIGSKGYIGIGLDENTSQFHNDFWEWDQLSNTWIRKANYGGIARFDAVGFSINSKGYIVTGDNNVTHPIDLWEYTTDNTIIGICFIDSNQNGIRDNGEPIWNHLMVSTSGNSNVYSTVPDSQGIFYINTDTGSFQTSVQNLQYYTFSPLTHTSTFSTYGNTDTVNFPVVPIDTIYQDLRISLVDYSAERVCDYFTYQIIYKNVGTKTMSGDIVMIKEHLFNIVTTTPIYTYTNGDTLKWNYSTIQPGETRTIDIQIHAKCPPFLNPLDPVSSVAYIEPITTDSTPTDNVSILKKSHILGCCSTDPNDKVMTGGDTLTPQQITNREYLTYVIHFQNTGTDTAHYVEIRDTLDAKLDGSTLDMVASSSPCHMIMINYKNIKWVFDNILLPDSNVDKPGSHGYVSYRIKPINTLQVGDSIKNSANIYFDFNAPVTTDTAITTIAVPTSVNEINDRIGFAIYPNPSVGTFSITFDRTINNGSIKIFNLLGVEIYSEKFLGNMSNETIKLKEGAGIYFMQVANEKEQFTKKLIIE